MVSESNLPTSVITCLSKITQLMAVVAQDIERSSQAVAQATQQMLEIGSQMGASEGADASLNNAHIEQAHNILMALQADDRTQQALSHLIVALTTASQEVPASVRLTAATSDATNQIADAILAHMKRASTVDYEREIFAPDLGISSQINNPDLENEVTFF